MVALVTIVLPMSAALLWLFDRQDRTLRKGVESPGFRAYVEGKHAPDER